MNVQFLIIIAVFLWAGFVCAISFMESWLKFRAVGITMPVGLSIGKLIFAALNKVEWGFSIIILVGIVLSSHALALPDKIILALIMFILLVQTTWLLPALDRRAKAIIEGKEIPRSNLHWYFVLGELVKLAALILFGVHFLALLVQSR